MVYQRVAWAFFIFLITLGVARSGWGEPTHPNEVGLYLTRDGSGPTGSSDLLSIVQTYLVLTRPRLSESGAHVTGITGFDLAMRLDPSPQSADIFLMSYTFPMGTIDCCPGLQDGWNRGLIELDVSVRSSEPVPVAQDAAVLMEMGFLQVSAVPFRIILEPLASPVMPSSMSFRPLEGNRQRMWSVSGSPTDPVFIFQGEAVPARRRPFGAVKALYR